MPVCCHNKYNRDRSDLVNTGNIDLVKDILPVLTTSSAYIIYIYMCIHYAIWYMRNSSASVKVHHFQAHPFPIGADRVGSKISSLIFFFPLYSRQTWSTTNFFFKERGMQWWAMVLLHLCNEWMCRGMCYIWVEKSLYSPMSSHLQRLLQNGPGGDRFAELTS